MTSENAAVECLAVGYNGSENSRSAVSWASRELASDGKLVIVHSCRPLRVPPSLLSTAHERAEIGRAILDELVLDGDVAMFDVKLVTEVSDENPVTAMLDAAKRHRANAIVTGREQHSRLRRAVGTVTSELQKSSPVPVIIVPVASVPEQTLGGHSA